MPSGVDLVDDEFILHVEGTASTPRVVRHIGVTSWPGLFQDLFWFIFIFFNVNSLEFLKIFSSHHYVYFKYRNKHKGNSLKSLL